MNNDRAAVLDKKITTSSDGEHITVSDKKEVVEKTIFRVTFGCINMPLIVRTTSDEGNAISAVVVALREGMDHITFDKIID